MYFGKQSIFGGANKISSNMRYHSKLSFYFLRTYWRNPHQNVPCFVMRCFISWIIVLRLTERADIIKSKNCRCKKTWSQGDQIKNLDWSSYSSSFCDKISFLLTRNARKILLLFVNSCMWKCLTNDRDGHADTRDTK